MTWDTSICVFSMGKIRLTQEIEGVKHQNRGQTGRTLEFSQQPMVS